MLPIDLKAEQFRNYGREARGLALEYLKTLQTLPLALLPSLLQEIAAFDWKFPAERKELTGQLAYLEKLPSGDRSLLLGGFARIRLSEDLERLDWVNSPATFVEKLSAHLWATHQMDAFRAAAEAYGERLYKEVSQVNPSVPRLTIVVIGQGVTDAPQPLFRKLRPHGVHFTNVQQGEGLKSLLEAAEERSRATPAPYAHWYIDGNELEPHDSALTTVSYAGLEPARRTLLSTIHAEIESGHSGPEALRSKLARLEPKDLGLSSERDEVLSRFNLRLLTESSGTQIFSTVFVQLAAKEALRRAQPLTMLVRFAPRQAQRPMNEMLSVQNENVRLDPIGSLIDADMGAYYIWLNQQRLAGAYASAFLAWFEGHNEAVVISPSVPRGTESSSPIELRKLIEVAS